ncbi:hypothetical protein [Robbsia sp. KACC 23696]|uniref:hypothetical protein n=1 Tax=Robbsia sp. KACC 23696 TaxID=3149231 RepID=UPI00325B70D9
MPSPPQHKHLVADAEKTENYAARRQARDALADRRGAGLIALHAMLPMAVTVIREAIKVEPRFNAETIFEYAYRKNAIDMRLLITGTREYRHCDTDEAIHRLHVDQRVRIPGGWSPAERIEGFNALPPGVEPQDVRLVVGINEIDYYVHFRNGYFISGNVVRDFMVAPRKPSLQPGPDGRYPTLRFRQRGYVPFSVDAPPATRGPLRRDRDDLPPPMPAIDPEARPDPQ